MPDHAAQTRPNQADTVAVYDAPAAEVPARAIAAVEQGPFPHERATATLRCLFIGAVLCAILAVAGSVNVTILHGGSITLDHTAIGAMAIFFGLVFLANGLARWLERRYGRRVLPVAGAVVVGSGVVLAAFGAALPPEHPYGAGLLVAMPRVLWVMGLAFWVPFSLLVVSRFAERIWSGGVWLSLSRAELLVVFAMLLIASSVATMGLVIHLVPTLPAVEYFGNSQNNRWPQLLMPHIPDWARVTDRTAVYGFFEGMWQLPWYQEPQEGRFEWPLLQSVYEGWSTAVQIPWGAWLRPLAAWGLFLGALYLFMICWMVLFRRQWMDREILAYPLAKLPEEMTRSQESPPDSQPVLAPLLRDPWMWLGFSLPVFLTSFNAIHSYVPGFPMIQLRWQTGIVNDQAVFYLYFSFVAIGVAYLVNTRISGSVWSLSLGGVLLGGWLMLRGLETPEYLSDYGTVGKPFVYHMGMGALLTLAVFTIWSARRHLAAILRKAVLNDPRIDDSDEILGYRPAFLGCLICAAIMIGWLIAMGMPWYVAAAFWLIMILIFHGVTRVVVEAGIGTCVAPGIAPVFTVSKMGAFVLTPQAIVALGMQYPYCADIRTFVMVAAAHGLKFTREVRRQRRRVFWAMLVALGVALSISTATLIFIAYTCQGTSLTEWFFITAPQKGPEYAATILQRKPAANMRGWYYSSAGVALMSLLMVANRRYLNWPIHPIGLAVMGIHLMARLWVSVFIAWLIKVLVLKYGGPRLYARTIPFFLGLILGQAVIVGVWILIDLAVGHRGNSTFWI